jgi:hypothetical protein
LNVVGRPDGNDLRSGVPTGTTLTVAIDRQCMSHTVTKKAD